jgi:hypothetical protein
MPLKAEEFDVEPVFWGVGHVKVLLKTPQTYETARGFEIYEAEGKGDPIFSVSTISGAEGAALKPGKGDFDLFINGCPVMIGGRDDCERAEGGAPRTDARSAPRIRLDYGDVIAYAPRDRTDPRKRVAKYIFTYARAQLGVFSYTAWVNGKITRVYPQGESWPMAQQITNGLSSAVLPGKSGEDVALTVDAALNRDVYDLLRRWRRDIERHAPLRKRDSTRRLAITLMDSNSGALLALASDDGTPLDPNDRNQIEESKEQNFNLVRHRIGSVIKPFTATAALSVFPALHRMTIIDERRDNKMIFGLPLGGKNGITGHLDGARSVTWRQFLPRSDNLFAVTLAMLGFCNPTGTTGLPRFSGSPAADGYLRLTLTDQGSSHGIPIWASSNMFDVEQGRCALLEQTPLKRQLEQLFEVRGGAPQVSSYSNRIWSPLEQRGMVSEKGLSILNLVSPEIPNLALSDIDNFNDLRSVLLGGEIGDLPEYGSVGSAWSNVYLAQSFARITTGSKVTARIIADSSVWAFGDSAIQKEELIPDFFRLEWTRAVLWGLEGVGRQSAGTAHSALGNLIRAINRNRGISDIDVPYAAEPLYMVGTGRRYFTVFCKTGTLDPDNEGPLHEDSIFVFTAGVRNDQTGHFCRAITGAIYLEQAKEGQAQRLAAELIRLLNDHPRIGWSKTDTDCQEASKAN